MSNDRKRILDWIRRMEYLANNYNRQDIAARRKAVQEKARREEEAEKWRQ